MKAVVWTSFGSPEVLQIQEVEKPEYKEDEVILRNHAASINSWYWELFSGKSSIKKGRRIPPRYKILGCDVAGVVESIGEKVTKFHVGDEVFGDVSGDGWGGFAEYVCAKERMLALKSPKMPFEQAAATPQAAVLALQGLRKGRLGPNQKILINGAGGGVGTFAVQIAKTKGAEVTAVDRSDKLDMLLSLGADHVIDYEKKDFTKNSQRYDVILDVISRRSIFKYATSLQPKGRCVLVGGLVKFVLPALIFGTWLLGRKKVMLLLLKPNPKDLEIMNQLFEQGNVKPVIDKTFPLRKIPEAFRYFGEGNTKGKLVISIRK